MSHRLIFANLLIVCITFVSFAHAAEETTAAKVISLEGTNWQLLDMKVLGGFLFTPEDPGQYRLNFRSDKRLTGTSDCNTITGAWFQESDSFRFDPFVATRKLCPPGSLHNNLVLILKDVNAITFSDGFLFMTNGADGVELKFEARGF